MKWLTLLFLALAAPLSAQTPSVLLIAAAPLMQLDAWYLKFGAREFAGCVQGAIRGDTLDIDAVWPADIDVSTDSSVTIKTPCAIQYPHVVATIHSHPDGINCSHYLRIDKSLMGEPGHVGTQTHVPTSDWWRFMRYTTDSVSMIYCGSQLVWLGRDGTEIHVDLTKAHPVEPLSPYKQT